MTRTALGLADDLADGIIAKRFIEIARAGERHPDLSSIRAVLTPRRSAEMCKLRRRQSASNSSFSIALADEVIE